MDLISIICTSILGVIFYMQAIEAGVKVEIIPQLSGNTLISYNAMNRSEVRFWVDKIKESLEEYHLLPNLEKPEYLQCSSDHPPTPSQICTMNVSEWGPCQPENNYAYHRNSPCVFFKISRSDDGIQNSTNVSNDLPETMPKHLKEKIKATDFAKKEMVWLTCEGSNAIDNELIGPIDYYPSPGIPGYYFSANATSWHVIRFLRPTSGIVIFVECRLWAKNIKENDPAAKIEFQLLLN